MMTVLVSLITNKETSKHSTAVQLLLITWTINFMN